MPIVTDILKEEHTSPTCRASLFGDRPDLIANAGPRQSFSGGTSGPRSFEMSWPISSCYWVFDSGAFEESPEVVASCRSPCTAALLPIAFLQRKRPGTASDDASDGCMPSGRFLAAVHELLVAILCFCIVESGTLADEWRIFWFVRGRVASRTQKDTDTQQDVFQRT